MLALGVNGGGALGSMAEDGGEAGGPEGDGGEVEEVAGEGGDGGVKHAVGELRVLSFVLKIYE